MTVRVEHGDCLDVMRALIAEGVRVHSIVTDPPYHLTSIVKRFSKTGAADRPESRVGAYTRHARGFMGRTWDGGDVAQRVETWELCRELLLPGGYLLAFGGSRTYARMAVAIEDAGFINHPLLGWVYAQGFPKAHKVNAEGWEGWRYGGQALKPALEPIYMGQKPMEGTGTENVLAYGTGALNIAGCRVGVDYRINNCASPSSMHRKTRAEIGYRHDDGIGPGSDEKSVIGRWPANLCHDGSEEVLSAFPETNSVGHTPARRGAAGMWSGDGGGLNGNLASDTVHDIGSAARFFYTAKADADDRCDSKHPTVKPVALLRWLVRLVTPPGGTVLDPFAGSGTTGVACIREGSNAILIEREAEYVRDIRHRLDKLQGLDAPLFAGLQNAPTVVLNGGNDDAESGSLRKSADSIG